MRAGLRAVAIFCGLPATGAFQSLASSTSTLPRRSWSVRVKAQPIPSFLDKLPEIPNPFEALKTADAIPSVRSLDEDQSFDPSPSGLFRQAKRVIAADLGVQEPGLLDEKFKWFGPVVDEPLGKTDYLAAGRFFDLRSAFPDLDYRAHDFRLDEEDPATVRLTCRVTGTMRGELRLRGEVLQPTGKTMKCPPEAVTMTFDLETGKVLKVTSGFVLDRLIGNTGGSTGVMAAAMVGGKSVSNWELYPAPTVASRFFGRPMKPLSEPRTFLAPFPETVMVQLAKGILAANMASEDASLLAKGFTYMTPTLGPVRKTEFLDKYAATEFEGVDSSFSHFRVDPFNPYVVWVDIRPTSPGYKGAPQAMSFTFDDDGFCSRITSGAVIDPTVGNGGGLAGIEGYKYAIGAASPAVVTRPLPRALGRVRRRLTGFLSGKGVDDFELPKASPRSTETASPIDKLSTLRAKTAEPIQAASPPVKPVQEPTRQSLISGKPSSAKSEQTGILTGNLPSLPQFGVSEPSAEKWDSAESNKTPVLSGFKLPTSISLPKFVSSPSPQTKKPSAQIAKQQASTKANVLAEEKRRRAAMGKAAAEKQAEEEKKKKRLEAQLEEARRKIKESKRKQADQVAKAAKDRQEAKSAAETTRLKQEEQRKSDAIVKEKEEQRRREQKADAQRQAKQLAAVKAAEQKRATKATATQKKLEGKQKQTEEQILSKLSQVTSRATIGLFGFGSSTNGDDAEPVAAGKPAMAVSTKKAPFGVPTLSKWRKNFDGSITGIISGSTSFGDGEKITTSAIAKGSIFAGEVVVTASGSKYFLV